MDAEARPLSEKIDAALKHLLELLPRHGAKYALIGGVAVGIRTRLRYTEDIDILLTVPALRLPGLLEALQERGFELDLIGTIRELTDHHFAVLKFEGVHVDFMKPMLPAYQHVLDRATEGDWKGQPVTIALSEGLIVMKLIASRQQDQLDIINLLAGNIGRLDLEYVEREWQTIYPIDDPRWKWFQEAVSKFYATT